MDGIPPARPSDNEDVIWALETAESLWKRNARVDAIVWLRRAAQEAAEAGDEDRASALMVEAVTLTDAISRASAHLRSVPPASRPPPEAAEDIDALLAATEQPAEEIESLDDADLISDDAAPPTPVPTGEPSAEEASVTVPLAPPTPLGLELGAAPPALGLPEESRDVASGDRVTPVGAEALPTEETPAPSHASSGPPALPGLTREAKPPTLPGLSGGGGPPPLPVLAADAKPPTLLGFAPVPLSQLEPPPAPEPALEASPSPDLEAFLEALPPLEPEPAPEAPPAPQPEPFLEALPPLEPEPIPEAAPPPEPEPFLEALPALEPEPFLEALPPLEPEPLPAPTEEPVAEPGDEAQRAAAEAPATEDAPVDAASDGEVPGITRMGADALSVMDLAAVEAFSPLSDEQRQRLVESASVVLCSAGVEIPACGLALVLDGEVFANADATGASIAPMRQGSVIRKRGTLGATVPARFTAALDDTTLALWTETGLADALVDAPGAARALELEGDRLQAWTSVATSVMASRLHEDIRLRLVGRLTARVLSPDAELVPAGGAVPGLLLVGCGTIWLDGPGGRAVGPGDFVFPEAAFSPTKASTAAHAGADGAVVLCADRHTTQELCATEPLLLELLASAC